MARRKWSELSQRQQQAVSLGAAAELVLTAVALRDLARRPDDTVRGSKRLWALSFVVQPFGPLAYFVAGRR